jgi:hypothetical protein
MKGKLYMRRIHRLTDTQRCANEGKQVLNSFLCELIGVGRFMPENVARFLMDVLCVAVGSSNPSLSTGVSGQSLIYPPGIVFAPSANGLPSENYVLSLPNTTAFNVPHGGSNLIFFWRLFPLIV